VFLQPWGNWLPCTSAMVSLYTPADSSVGHLLPEANITGYQCWRQQDRGNI
jgi:hypothetical protein